MKYSRYSVKMLPCRVVRHKAVESQPLETVDKFRVDAFVGSKLIGRKHVLASVTREKVSEVSIFTSVC